MVGPEILVCIPVIYGNHNRESLDSNFPSKHQNCEVIGNDSTDHFIASDLTMDTLYNITKIQDTIFSKFSNSLGMVVMS